MNMSLAEQLEGVLEARPFDHLGLFETENGWFVRVFMPGANKIEIVDLRNHRIEQMVAQDELGLFEHHWQADEKPIYKLNVTRGEDRFTVVDAFQFADRALQDFQCDADTLYKNMGAQVCQADIDGLEFSGVRFAVYAPNARSVSVIGNFNDWDGRRHPMQSGRDGIWRLFIPEVLPGDQYKFEIKNSSEQTLPHKTDPYNFYCGQFPDFHSIVFDHQQYRWQDAAWLARDEPKLINSPMSIYEIHAGSWCHTDGRPLTYRELADKLVPYLKDMCFTHVEFLPISEYPFDGSWGYQPLGMFAPTSRFGTPDDFKYLVDQCHQNNIGVIVDWVPAHFPSDEHGLALFDGTALYEYEDPRRGWHPDWHSYIYDFGRFTVRDFLISSAMIWLDYFHVDGLRVDAVASMLYLDYSRKEGEWVPNVDGGNHNYEAIEFIKRFNETAYRRFPKSVTIAEESTAFDGVSRPIYSGGLGFGFKWNMGWMHDTLDYLQKDPIHRKYHHGEMTFSMVYAYNENFVLPLSHDEVVHGKRSILNRMPGDEWQQTANLRAYYGFMFGHPGKKLNFMGNEIAQGIEWNHNAQLDWYLLDYDRHRGVQTLFRDLNKLYCCEPALHELDHEPRGFTWINHDDSNNSVFSFIRFSESGDQMIVVTNLTPTPHDCYQIGVSSEGSYELMLNTDSEFYGGSNYPTGRHFHTVQQRHDDLPFSLTLALPPLATIFLKRIAD